MRGTMAEAFPDTATIQRAAKVSDGGGEFAMGWSDLATGVACRISPLKGGEGGKQAGTATTGDRAVDETTHVVTFANGRDITEKDRIVVSGQVYEVTLVRKRGGWELSRRVEVKEEAP